jgi:hypothetical protein
MSTEERVTESKVIFRVSNEEDKSRQRPRDYSVAGGSGVGERFEAQSK